MQPAIIIGVGPLEGLGAARLLEDQPKYQLPFPARVGGTHYLGDLRAVE